MNFHHQPLNDVLSELNTDKAVGLSTESARQLLQENGSNKLREKRKKSNFARFIDQFKDVMIIILIIAAIVSFTVICVEKNWGELFEPALILLIVILNAIMGVMQESKAEKALEAYRDFPLPMLAL